MNDRAIADAAIACVGTPWHHQGRVRGVGCDCVGLGIIAGKAVGLEVVDFLQYAEDPDPAVLLSYLEKNCVKQEQSSLQNCPTGYGLLFWMSSTKEPKHFAIKTDKGMVHALRRRSGDGCVRNDRITKFFSSRLHSIWRYRWRP